MSTTGTPTPHALASILPDSYLLAYAIPLLLLSIIATFAGAFLTLDRTRSFAPIDKPAVLNHGESWWRLEGGLGGLIGGWLCGLHLTTFLSLLVINRSSLGLTGIQFLVIWALCTSLLAAVGGRWRIAAFVFYSLIGGASLTALITIIFLPKSLLPRLIIGAILILASLVGTLLPIPRVQHWALRISASSTGAVGVVIAVALFNRVPSWSNPWLVFAIAPYVGAIDAQEKGLSALLALLAAMGAAVDWVLKWKLGEAPDKAWDEYLARYTRDLPLSSERQGMFEPPQSFWSRLLSFGHKGTPYHKASREIIFPPDSHLLPTTTKSSNTSSKPLLLTSTPPPAFRPYLAKRQSTAGTRRTSNTLSKRSAKVEYHEHSAESDSSEDGGGDADGTPKFRPWLKKRQSSSASHSHSVATTVVSLATPHGGDPMATSTLDKVDEYSDVDEQDVVAALSTGDVGGGDDDKGKENGVWKPAFLRKHEEKQRRASLKWGDRTTVAPLAEKPKSSSSGISAPPRFGMTSPTSPPPPPRTQAPPLHPPLPDTTTTSPPAPSLTNLEVPLPLGAVPATPSLIRAYNRITQAQQEAHTRASASFSSSTRPLPPAAPQRTQTDLSTAAKVELDDSFWTKVRVKAAEYRGRPAEDV